MSRINDDMINFVKSAQKITENSYRTEQEEIKRKDQDVVDMIINEINTNPLIKNEMINAAKGGYRNICLKNPKNYPNGKDDPYKSDLWERYGNRKHIIFPKLEELNDKNFSFDGMNSNDRLNTISFSFSKTGYWKWCNN